VVLYDHLANPRILANAPLTAELVCVGKHGKSHLWSQEEINARVLAEARQGKTVVRLKGGDSTVFARIAEETESLLHAETPFEIVPGITAALAAGAYAGIPITHRDFASAAALVTGQEHPAKEGSTLDWGALARFPGTLVFYMGVTTARRWTEELIKHGKSPATPAAIVRRCSLPDQLTIRCTLADVADHVEAKDGGPLRPPAVVIVGEVASLSPALSWFEQRPLFGLTVLVTRPHQSDDPLEFGLRELGAEVLHQPVIKISDPPAWEPVDDAIRRVGSFNWLVFTSANGVRYFLNRIFTVGLDLRILGNAKLAVIGPGTAHVLNEYHLRADCQPDRYDAEALAERLALTARSQRFLYARASRGRDTLPCMLRNAGAEVDEVVVYSNADVNEPDAEIAARLAAGEIHWTTATSSAIARNLAAMFGEALSKTRIASISPLTSGALRECGLEPAAEAVDYTMDGVIAALRNAVVR
jgi:uroporphyrinogen III methyltransferase/synthase